MSKALLLLTIFLAIAVPSVPDHYGLTVSGGITIYPYEVALFATLYIFVLGLLLGKQRLAKPLLATPLILFLIVIALQTAWGSQQYGIKSALYDVRTTTYYALFFIAASVLRTRSDFEAVLKAMVLGAIAYAGILGFEFLMKTGPLWSTRPLYMEGANRIGSSNALVPLFILPFAILPIAILMDRKWKILSALAGASLVLTLLISQSRAGMLFAVLVIGCTMLVLARLGAIKTILKWGTLTAFSCAVGVFVLDAEFITRLSAISELSLDSSFNTRFLTALLALDKIIASPWVGYGFGGLMMESSPELKGTILDMTNFFIDWTWITLVYKVGIIGAATFTWLWWKELRLIHRIRSIDAWTFAMKSCLLISAIIMVLASIQNVFLIRGQLVVFLAAFLAMSESLFHLSSPTETTHG